MLRAGRLSAVRSPLPCLGLALLSATVLAFAAGADPARAATFSYSSSADSLLPATGLTAPVEPQRASKRRASPGKSSSGRRAQCAAAARAGGDRKAHQACAVKKKKANGSKPNAARTPAGAKRPSSPAVEPNSTPALVIDGPPPTDALTAEPVVPTTPVDPVVPVEPKPPLELNSPIEPTPPIEESKPPVEEEKAKEVKAEEEKAKAEEKANEEKAKAEKVKEEQAKEAKAKEEKAKEEQRLKVTI